MAFFLNIWHALENKAMLTAMSAINEQEQECTWDRI